VNFSIWRRPVRLGPVRPFTASTVPHERDRTGPRKGRPAGRRRNWLVARRTDSRMVPQPSCAPLPCGVASGVGVWWWWWAWASWRWRMDPARLPTPHGRRCRLQSCSSSHWELGGDSWEGRRRVFLWPQLLLIVPVNVLALAPACSAAKLTLFLASVLAWNSLWKGSN
jgi:hypothetical protein